jgi:hypothetical protein
MMVTLTEIVVALITTAGTIIAVTVPIQLKNNRELKTQNVHKEYRDKEVDRIINELTTAIVELQTFVKDRASINDEQYQEQRQTNIALIRDRISQAHAHFTVKGSIDKYTRQSLDSLYKQYKNTEENSFVKDLVMEIRQLPIKDR